jgi:hypothetical protein
LLVWCCVIEALPVVVLKKGLVHGGVHRFVLDEVVRLLLRWLYLNCCSFGDLRLSVHVTEPCLMFGVFFLELLLAVNVVHNSADDDAEEEDNESGLEHGVARLEGVVDTAVHASLGVLSLSLVDADVDHVIVKVEASVEVAEEDRTEAVLALDAAELFDADLATLLLRRDLVSVALRLQGDRRRLKLETDVLQLLVGQLAVLVCFHGDAAIKVSDRVESESIALLGLDFLKHVIEDELGELDRDVSRIDDSDFRALALRHIDTVVHEIIHHKTPVITAKIRVEVETSFTALNLSEINIAEADP